MLSTQSLREQLDRYAEGSLGIESLEEWLASETWDINRWASRGLQHLVQSIQSVLIRHTSGDATESEVDSFLRERRLQLHRASEAGRDNRKALADALDSIKNNRVTITINDGVTVSEQAIV